MQDADRENGPNEISVDEAFSCLANPIRISILRTLWEASESTLNFAELRKRIEMRDSGKFNYHLGKLVGSFVRQTNQGYELREAGFQVIGAILAGVYHQSVELGPLTLEEQCPECAVTLEATSVDDQILISCPECKNTRSRIPFPPGALAVLSHDELPYRLDEWIRAKTSHIIDGICPDCSGQTTGSLIRDPDEFSDGVGHDVGVEYQCNRCSRKIIFSVGDYLLHQSVVIAFHYAHGIDLKTEPTWELQWLIPGKERIVTENPLQVEYSICLDAAELCLRIDKDLNVTEQDP